MNDQPLEGDLIEVYTDSDHQGASWLTAEGRAIDRQLAMMGSDEDRDEIMAGLLADE